jgi:hypothetical protein
VNSPLTLAERLLLRSKGWDMAKRALRVVKNLGRIPAVAVCTVCGKTFEAPLGALVSVKDAEANLQQQFYGHKCEQKDARQTGRL